MDVEKMLALLREELAQLDAAILRLKRLRPTARKKPWTVFQGRKAKPAVGYNKATPPSPDMPGAGKPAITGGEDGPKGPLAR